jgi:hypothetical protein
MAAILPEFQVNISQKRWTCVLDPTLALSIHGLPLLTQLGTVLEMWIARELWHILDNTHYYLERPEILLATGENDSQTEKVKAVVRTLLEWERIRLDNDPSRQYCYWIGDSPLESFLPEGITPNIVGRYEALSAALDKRIPNKDKPLPSAYRDTATLAVCLPSAFVLTHLSSDSTENSCPAICQVLEAGGIPCQKVATDDLWQKQESKLLRQMLVQTGLAKWIWSGLKLAVLQIAAPDACIMEAPNQESREQCDYGLDEIDSAAIWPSIDYWRGARGFWYPL